MSNSPKTLMVTLGIVLALGLFYFEMNKLSEEPKESNPACKKTEIIRVKPGIIDRTEEGGKSVTGWLFVSHPMNMQKYAIQKPAKQPASMRLICTIG